MCCIVTMMLLIGPRITGVIWWILRPALWNTAFGSLIWPVLGLIFLPWTTLLYMLLFPGGITGFEWFLIVLGVLADITTYGGGAYGNRDRIRM